MTVTLGVPTLNRYDLLVKLLASARSGSRPPDAALIVDNGGSLQIDGDAVVVRPGRNVGVGPAWNLMARASLLTPKDRLLISGDDVELNADTVAVLLRVQQESGADFVYPATMQGNMFSCFLVAPSLFAKVGYFDEQFVPAYFEDNDFHYRMKLVGAKEVAAPCGVIHGVSQTLARFTPAQMEAHHARFRELRALYSRKWGGEPGAERFKKPYDEGLETDL